MQRKPSFEVGIQHHMKLSVKGKAYPSRSKCDGFSVGRYFYLNGNSGARVFIFFKVQSDRQIEKIQSQREQE